MNPKSAGGFILLAGAFALASWLGWWGVPLVGLLWGWLRPAVSRPVLWSAAAALLAWAGWLGYDRLVGGVGFGTLLTRLSGIMALPPVALPVLTLAFAALLAGSATAVSGALAHGRSRSGGRHPPPPSAAGTRSGN